MGGQTSHSLASALPERCPPHSLNLCSSSVPFLCFSLADLSGHLGKMVGASQTQTEWCLALLSQKELGMEKMFVFQWKILPALGYQVLGLFIVIEPFFCTI